MSSTLSITHWDVCAYQSDGLGEPLFERRCHDLTSINQLFPECSNPQEYKWVYRTQVDIRNHNFIQCNNLTALCSLHVDEVVVAEPSNEFHPHIIRLRKSEKEQVALRFEFESVSNFLLAKQPRPKWKTNLAHNNLRFIRSSLLGHVTGWANEAPLIGITSDVVLLTDNLLNEESLSLFTSYENDIACLHISHNTEELIFNGITIQNADTNDLIVEMETDSNSVTAELPMLAPWMPHTHGLPELHNLTVSIRTNHGEIKVTRKFGFKSIELVKPLTEPKFLVNRQSIFLRGSCWTTSNYPFHDFDEGKAKNILSKAKSLGLNLIRVSGTMRYEHENFYSLCDELGLLVWQDLMFANFDYPQDDSFTNSVKKELRFQVTRLNKHPSLAILCGSSEVEQQAAMVGRPRIEWSSDLFANVIPDELSKRAPNIPYIPSSPTGGELPFQTDFGFSHYFGYGAYQRGEDDLRLANVKFASECLGLSHTPTEHHNKLHFGFKNPSTNLPIWKAGIPRDASTGWDFEDIRDYYVESYFGEDSRTTRYQDLETYHERCRILTGYMMAQAYNYWRSEYSACEGAISWWLNDFKPGAGWGLVDSDGELKPAANVLKWQLQPLHIGVLDNGLNGHSVSLVNETHESINGQLTVQCIQSNRNAITQKTIELVLPPDSSQLRNLSELFGQFIDSSYAYRFGPEPFDAIGASFSSSGVTISDAQFPHGLNLPTQYEPSSVEFKTTLETINNRMFLRIISNRLVAFASLTLKNAQCLDNNKTLLPGVETFFEIQTENAQVITGSIKGLNMAFRSRFTLEAKHAQ